MEKFDAEHDRYYCKSANKIPSKKIKKFSKETLEKYEEFNEWLTHLFVDLDNPKLIAILTMKHLLKRYFSSEQNYITTELQRIPIVEIKKIFCLKTKYGKEPSNYGEFDNFLMKCKLRKPNDEEKKIFSNLYQKDEEEREMEDKYLKYSQTPTMLYLFQKIESTIGYFLRLLLQKEAPENNLDMFREMQSKLNIQGYYSYMSQILKSIFKLGFRVTQILEKSRASFTLVVNKKLKIISNLRKINFALRTHVGGKIIKNFLFNLSSDGMIFQEWSETIVKGIEEKSNSIFGVDSFIDLNYEQKSLFSDGNMSFLADGEQYGGAFEDFDFDFSNKIGILF